MTHINAFVAGEQVADRLRAAERFRLRRVPRVATGRASASPRARRRIRRATTAITR